MGQAANKREVCTPLTTESTLPASITNIHLDDFWEAAPEANPGGSWEAMTPRPSSSIDWNAAEAQPYPKIAQVPPTTSLGTSGNAGDLIYGLAEWLESMSLEKYCSAASDWCADMGAISMDEVEEHWE